MKYQGLSDLLGNDPQAKNFFSQLPSYMQDQIYTQATSVDSLDNLKLYAANLADEDAHV